MSDVELTHACKSGFSKASCLACVTSESDEWKRRAEEAEALLSKNEGRIKEIVDEKLIRERDALKRSLDLCYEEKVEIEAQLMEWKRRAEEAEELIPTALRYKAAVEERDDWKRRAELAEECGEIIRNTLRSDEGQFKQLAKRHAEMREDIIRTACERDAIAVQNDALREALVLMTRRGAREALALPLPRAAEIVRAMREVCEAIKRAAKENEFLLSRDERAALSRLLEVERGSAGTGDANAL